MLDAAFRYVLSKPPRLASASGSVKALTGLSQEDFLASRLDASGVDLRDRVHGEDVAFFDSLFSPDIQPPSGRFNIRIRHADGTIRCVKGNFEKAHAPNGEIELQLHLSDARTVSEPGDSILINSFKTLIEQTSDYIYIKSRNHVILAASRTLPSLSDSAKAQTDLIGTTDYDNHPEEAADVYYRLEEQAFAQGKRVDQVQQVRKQDGTTAWIDNRKYPINGPDGEIIGIFGVAPDITEAIETRKKLVESEGWLRDA
jgi:hypothetical protein